jgi:hypothetical protein
MGMVYIWYSNVVWVVIAWHSTLIIRYELHGMDGVHYNNIKGKTIESDQRVYPREI